MVDTITPTTPTVTTQTAASQNGDASEVHTKALASDFETFLTMLTTQVQNQDPLNPMDSSDYASQLATFSSVEQQIRSNDILSEIKTALAGSGLEGLGNWIGREGLVRAPARFDGQPIVIRPEYAADADRGVLKVTGPDGELVERIAFGANESSLTWQGLDANGNALPSGTYRFDIESYAGDALIDSSMAKVYSRIEEVRSDNSGAILIRMADGTEVSSDQITGLRVPS